MNMRTTFEHGASTFSNEQFVGFSVSELRSVALVKEFLSLTGNESVEVKNAGDSEFLAVGEDYVIEEGDTVVFRQTTGGKGI